MLLKIIVILFMTSCGNNSSQEEDNRKSEQLKNENTKIISLPDLYKSISHYEEDNDNDLEEISKFIKKVGIFNTDLKSSESNILMVAMEEFKDKIVNLILEILSQEEDKEKIKNFVNKKDSIGSQAIHIAISKDNVSLIDKLFKLGSDIDGKNDEGDTPLHLASGTYDDNVNLIEKLINLGANINSQNNNNDTPLHIAVRNQKIERVKFLLSKNAKQNIKNMSGYIPLEEAKANNFKEITELLEKD